MIENIRAGAFVCTSSRRLKRHISASYDQSMLLEGLRAWETPGVVELEDWLASLFTEQAKVSTSQTLLSRGMATALWEEVLSMDSEFSSGPFTATVKRNSIVSLSFDAYCLLKDHQAKLPANIYLTREAFALKRWSLAYEKLLKEKGFICPGALSFVAAELIAKKEVELKGDIVFAGFEEVSPALKLLIEALTGRGVRVSFWPDSDFKELLGDTDDMERSIKAAELFVFSDMREEVVQAARWARENAMQGKKTGIIVTNLTQYKELIEREFAAELAPASALLDGAGAVMETFNIVKAASLSKSPIVKSALELLSITEPGRALETELMWEIVSSPYLHASREEYFSLAAIDARLRRFNRSNLSLYGLSKELSNIEGDALKSFKDRVDSFIDILKSKEEKYSKESPSVWAGRFFAELTGFGWPGNLAQLTSREFQAYEAFNALLSEFAALDDITSKISRREAVSKLLRMAEKKTHQPKSPETLVEVIGLDGSIGFDFDAVRIIGAYGDVLPGAIDPNPFIPINTQRELELTRASPELQARRAKERLLRLLKGAEKVVVSCPERIDGKEVRVSPFFSSLPVSEIAENRESKRFKDLVHASSLLEDMQADPVVDFAAGEIASLGGGTSILKDQSACPFKAFATHRLGARIVESPEPGLSYMDRGTLLHSALQIFWKEVNDSEVLNKLIREDRLVVQIKGSVDDALKKNKKLFFGEVNYLNLEKDRLVRLLMEWLAFEATRGPFVVERLEIDDEREVSGLNIKFRIDRVDTVVGLGHAVIDYKTGKSSRYDWLGKRPKDPQMLFYNLFGPYEALAFARVKFGECKFEGITASPEMLPGNKGFDKEGWLKNSLATGGIDSFDDLTDSWRLVVESLAKDFAGGVSIVDPNAWGSSKGQSACYYSYCALKPLCRIFEAEEEMGEEL